MSEKGYLVAWLIYLLCSVGLLTCFYYLTRPLYRWLRLPLRLSAMVFLLLPWTAYKDGHELAPAWLTSLFDALLKQDASFLRAGVPLLAALLLALLLSALWLKYRRPSA